MGVFLYLLRQYFCRGDSFIYIFFVFFKIFIDFVEIMRHLAYSLSNLTLIILSIKIKTLTRNEKEKVICCSFVDFIALYSHATISHLTPFTICVVVYESTSDVMNLFIKLQLFIKLALASSHPYTFVYHGLDW